MYMLKILCKVHLPDLAPIRRFPGQPGLQIFPEQQGLQIFPGQPGLLIFPGQPGLQILGMLSDTISIILQI